jgi:tRNA-dihydrouridine synthase A
MLGDVKAKISYPRIAVAPMMDWTDRHCRYFLRLLSPSVQLYTEMITAAAIVHGDRAALLRYDESEHPVAVQLGGSDVGWMTSAAKSAAEFGFDEININIGCPSDRVQSGQFGACLMAEPELVAECFASMQEAVDVPITIKTRIGIDEHDSYEFLRRFVDPLVSAGCRKFIVHARIAILEGLSPKENRSIPPLNYERVYQLKQDYPDLEIVINGGIRELAQIDDLLERVDGVMIGRQAYSDPFLLARIEQHLNPDWTLPQRHDIVERMLPYIERELADGERLSRITRHMLGLFTGQAGARAWRRYLSEHAYAEGAGLEVVLAALKTLPVAA